MLDESVPVGTNGTGRTTPSLVDELVDVPDVDVVLPEGGLVGDIDGSLGDDAGGVLSVPDVVEVVEMLPEVVVVLEELDPLTLGLLGDGVVESVDNVLLLPDTLAVDDPLLLRSVEDVVVSVGVTGGRTTVVLVDVELALTLTLDVLVDVDNVDNGSSVPDVLDSVVLLVVSVELSPGMDC